jgi:hypothetical protein
MEIDDRLKKFIFKKLAKDLSHVEVIPYEDSIWFIDRDNNYWYLQLKKNGHLWWRLDFFDIFFQIFSLDRDVYEPIIIEWVEQILKRKVNTTRGLMYPHLTGVKQILKQNVNTTSKVLIPLQLPMENILNSK